MIWRIMLVCYGAGCDEHSHPWHDYATIDRAIRAIRQSLGHWGECCDDMDYQIVEVEG